MSEEVQLALAFDHRPALGGEDFLVAPPNAQAVAWIDRWPDWPTPSLALWGPPGCGKTHLVNVFVARSGAHIVTADDLASEAAAQMAAAWPACAVDDAERVAAGAEEALLHLHNALAENGRRLLLAARRPPSRWRLGLADLASRLRAAPAAEICAPDDALMAAVLVKLFADRQLRVDTGVVSFMLARMARSFAAARRLVAAVDAAALARRRNITVPLVRQVIDGPGGAEGEGDGGGEG